MSIGTMSGRWLRRKLRQVGEGTSCRHGMQRPTWAWMIGDGHVFLIAGWCVGVVAHDVDDDGTAVAVTEIQALRHKRGDHPKVLRKVSLLKINVTAVGRVQAGTCRLKRLDAHSDGA